jgi:hypothetical protein
MKKLIKLTMVLLVVILFLPTCKKDTAPTVCMVIDANQNKRKVIFTYKNNTTLTRITDYSDSSNFLTANIYDLSYNNYGQVASITAMHESGLYDSISFDFTNTSKIRETQYVLTDGKMILNYTRNFSLDVHGYIASDTLYGVIPARKSMIMSGYTTYTYDASYNLLSINNFTPGGYSNFAIAYSYTDTLIQSNSYNIARFTSLSHYGSEYQWIFPQMYNLPLTEVVTTNGSATTHKFTYTLDAYKNALIETLTVPGCVDCGKTTNYKYGCF